MTGLELFWMVTTIVAALGSAVAIIFSRRRKDIDALEIQHRDELESLARTRKEIIEQLRGEMEQMKTEHRQEIADLNKQIAELRGAYNAMRNFQVQEIIDGVLKGLGATDL